jgi:hypothetical protein
MALFLKPLTDEVIETMGFTSSDLWLVKIGDEVFGPFETASLHDYAAENSHEFINAHATMEEPHNWQPFFSIEQFHLKKPEPEAEVIVEERYWVLNQGQKAGPFPRMTIDKKLEMGTLSLNDVVSVDDGHTWNKFYQVETFNPEGAAGGVEALPMAPLESAFARAKEDLQEKMDAQERTGSHAGLASLVYLGQSKDRPTLKLDEIDLKSLEETEVTRSLKWAIPSAVAGVGVLVALGNFIMSPSTSNDVAEVQEKSEVIMPSAQSTASVPAQFNRSKRNPASYMPQPMQRSGLTNVPPVHYNEYQGNSHIERHENDPDPMIEPASEGEPTPQEHSLVQNQGGGESLDGVMSGGTDVEPQPEAPVIEEAGDF